MTNDLAGACCQKIRGKIRRQECYVSRVFYYRNVSFLATNFGYDFFCNRPQVKVRPKFHKIVHEQERPIVQHQACQSVKLWEEERRLSEDKGRSDWSWRESGGGRVMANVRVCTSGLPALAQCTLRPRSAYIHTPAFHLFFVLSLSIHSEFIVPL